VTADEGEDPRPLVSVVIAAWNAAGTIERALDSALETRGVALECIVVDDGSTDGTADVVERVSARDPRVVPIRLPANVGVSAARNVALDRCRGTWLAFLDADDRFLPGAIEALARPVIDPTVRAVIGQRIWTDGERTWLTDVYDIPDIRQPGRKSIVANPGLLYYAAMLGKLFHRSLTDGLRFEGRVLGDQPWTIRALLRAGDGIEVIDTTVYEWRRPHPDHYVATITTAKQRSAAKAVEMVVVARGAWAQVAAEVDTRVAVERDRRRVKIAYAERLARSDLADAMRRASDARDPATADLFDEVERFVSSLPSWVVVGSATFGPRLLRVPAARWHRLSPDARRSFWRLHRVIAAADPRVWRRAGSAVAPALLVARLGSPVGTGLAGACLWAASAIRTAVGRVHRR
jgi:Glycosyl transferase family 2